MRISSLRRSARRRALALWMAGALLLFRPTGVPAEPPPPDGARTLARLVDEAIADRTVAGAVVAVGGREGVSFLKAYGRVSADSGAADLRADAVFDVASLTKVLATAPVLVKLAEAGRLALSDPLVRWLPELRGGGRDRIRLVDLLTHTSGLADLEPSGSGMEEYLRAVAGRRPQSAPGARFRYADVNFILLGEVARRAGSAPLDELARTLLYEPLGMKDTRFLPASTQACAPTLDAKGSWRAGTVQDRTAALLGGVAGHAGLFSTAADLAAFCRMMLSGGTLEAGPVLSREAVRRLTAPAAFEGGRVVRALGWDVASPYSAPREGFGSESYGHTGYSGGSLWLDPATDRFVVLLTVRRNYREPRRLNELRAAVSRLVAQGAFGPNSEPAVQAPAP